jgi:tetratricopeptide (TPR) repeat protein
LGNPRRIEKLTKNNHLSMRCIAYGYRNLGELNTSIEYFKKSLNAAKEEFFSTHPKTLESNKKFELEYHGYYYDLIATLALTSQSHEIIEYCEEGLQLIDPDQNAIALFSLSFASTLQSLDLLSISPNKANNTKPKAVSATQSSEDLNKVVYFKQNIGHAYNMTGRPQLAAQVLTVSH